MCTHTDIRNGSATVFWAEEAIAVDLTDIQIGNATATRSPLSNRGYERSEHPRTAGCGEGMHPGGVPKRLRYTAHHTPRRTLEARQSARHGQRAYGGALSG